jgi:glutamate/tyrosine decarboxylase-like PLP-dependent enzyme
MKIIVQEGDGIFSPGGSLSNMYGMVLARQVKHPQFKTKGNILKRI